MLWKKKESSKLSSPIQRITVTEKYRPYYEEKAKENKSLNGGNKKSEYPISVTPIEKVHTTDELARLANVGHTAYLIRGTKFRSPLYI